MVKARPAKVWQLAEHRLRFQSRLKLFVIAGLSHSRAPQLTRPQLSNRCDDKRSAAFLRTSRGFNC